MRAICIRETGGPEQLKLESQAEPSAGEGQVVIAVEAVGINFIDIYNRIGLYAREMPFVAGAECAGRVTQVGEGVFDFKLGDRVATAQADGAYAEFTTAAASKVVRLPETVTFEHAAALTLQGCTAHYLACDTFQLKAGDVALVHAAAGGVGLLLTQIAKHRGARVIAVIGSEQKMAVVRDAGADEIIVSSAEDFSTAARRLTAGRGVDVVYDSVGRATFDGSLACLRPRGMFVSYGNSSGPAPQISPLSLMERGSLFFTRPTLGHYTATQLDLQARADDLFRWVQAGWLKVHIGGVFPLAEAAEAHRALESRKTSGKLLLVIR